MTLDETRLIEELQELNSELDILVTGQRDQKISFFRPIGRQGLATKALNEGTNVVLVFGSNRSGKSVWGAAEACAHSYGFRPWLPEDHPDYRVRLADGNPIPVPNVGRIIAQNYKQAMAQTIQRKIEEWFPRGHYKIKKDNQGNPVKVELANKSVIWLMSNEQDDMAFEGTDGHWVWADEPIDYSKYIGLKRGLIDHSGHMWMTCTPLTQPWMADKLLNRADEIDEETGRIAVRFFKFSIWHNCRDYGGHLRREDILEFLKDLDEAELEARLHGNPLHLAGRVYKQWSPEAPLWVPAFRIPVTYPRVCVIDPHPRKPVAVLWAAISPDDQVIVYRDLFDAKLRTVKDVADRIKMLEGWTWHEDLQRWERGEKAEPVTLRIIDNSAHEEERTSGDTILNRFRREQIWCALAKKRNAEAGYDAIHEALKLRYEWNEPGLITFSTCHHVKKNFLNFVWDEWATSKQRDQKGPKQEVRKNNDDFIDCIRYIYQFGVTYHMLRNELKRKQEREEGPMVSEHLQGPMTRKERNKWRASSRFSRKRGSNSRGMEQSCTIRTSFPMR